jgi:uncharacterized integral membrane protein
VADARRNGNGIETRTKVRLVVALVLVALLVAFVLDNTDDVEVGFVFGDAEISLIWVLVGTAVIGALIDRLWLWSRRRD